MSEPVLYDELKTNLDGGCNVPAKPKMNMLSVPQLRNNFKKEQKVLNAREAEAGLAFLKDAIKWTLPTGPFDRVPKMPTGKMFPENECFVR